MFTRRLVLASVLAFLILQLNIYFAWTSHVGMSRDFHHSPLLRLFLVGEVEAFTRIQLSIPSVGSYFSNLATNVRSVGPPQMLEMKLFIDCEVIVFTLAIFLISLLLFRRGGSGVAILRAVEITSAAILPLGIEIYLYDRFQFNIHASDIQVKLGLAWFTNADVLYVSSSILIVALVIEILRHAKKSGMTGIRPEEMALESKVGHWS
jgi:hypothetical protein